VHSDSLPFYFIGSAELTRIKKLKYLLLTKFILNCFEYGYGLLLWKKEKENFAFVSNFYYFL